MQNSQLMQTSQLGHWRLDAGSRLVAGALRTGLGMHRRDVVLVRSEKRNEEPKVRLNFASAFRTLRKRLSSSHLDGTYPGDAGFDPLRLGKDPNQLKKLREAEVMHARWAMIGVVGLIVPEVLGAPVVLVPDIVNTGPFLAAALSVLVIIAAVEGYRALYNMKTVESEKRVYPGKKFDFLGLTKDRTDSAPGLGVFSAWIGGLPGWLSGGWWFDKPGMTKQELQDMKAKELRNGRLAMVSFLGAYIAASVTGKGPLTLLYDHVADPMNNTIIQTVFSK